MLSVEPFTPAELIEKGFAHPAEFANWPFPFTQGLQCLHEDYVRLPEHIQSVFSAKPDANGSHFRGGVVSTL
jgi:hypothetical protein